MAVLKIGLSCLVSLNGSVVVVAKSVEAVDRDEYDDEKNEGRLGGSYLNVKSLSDSNLMSHEEIVPNDGEKSASNGAEKNNEDEVHSLLVYAEVCSDLVVVLGHYVPSIDAVDTAGYEIKKDSY